MKNKTLLILFICYFFSNTLFAQDKEIVFTSDPIKLSETINTPVVNAEPKLSPDGSRLYFCRRDNVENIGVADIWYSEPDKDGKWGKPKNMGRPVNDESFNMLIGARSDGNALLVIGDYLKKGRNKLYIVYKEGGNWMQPQLVDIENSPEAYSYGVSADFRVLIISANSNITNERDLFVSFQKDKKTWSEPKYMGDLVNSMGAETFPTLANDGKTLYFSSAGMGGYGRFDVFMSRRLDDSWVKWSKPQNMGSKINTPSYDADFTVDEKGKYAYISSDYGSTDLVFSIYKIELPSDAKPKPVVVFRGQVLNQKTNKPIEAEVTYHRISDGKKLGTLMSAASSGGFTIILPCGEKYGFESKAEGYISISDYIDLTNADEHQTIVRDIKMVPFKVGEVVRMNNLFFDTGKAELNTDSYTEIEKVILLLKQNKNMIIEIIGHTDSEGKEADNQMLSEQRAKNVSTFIINKGINASRVKHKGMGEKKPVTSNKTPKGRERNRRVEFKILKK